MRFFFLLFFLLFSHICFSQRNFSWTPQISADYTYTGFSITPSAGILKGHNSISAGLKYQISRSYLPLQNVWGWELLYRYHHLPDKKFTFHFEFSYQGLSSKSYAPGSNSSGRNYIHELLPGYGFRWKIADWFFIGNTFSIGTFYERYHNADLQEKKTFVGLNTMFRVFTGIQF